MSVSGAPGHSVSDNAHTLQRTRGGAADLQATLGKHHGAEYIRDDPLHVNSAT